MTMVSFKVGFPGYRGTGLLHCSSSFTVGGAVTRGGCWCHQGAVTLTTGGGGPGAWESGWALAQDFKNTIYEHLFFERTNVMNDRWFRI